MRHGRPRIFMLICAFVLAGGTLLLPPRQARAFPSGGTQLWEAQYDNGGNDDAAAAEAVSSDGSQVFVTGSTVPGSHSTDYDYLTVSFDTSTGAVTWAQTFDAGEESWDQADAIAVSPDGSKVFVTGFAGLPGSDYQTLAYDASTGSLLWQSRYNGPGNLDDTPIDIDASPDSASVFVTGRSWGGAGTGLDYATVAYDASTGSERWVSRYNSCWACDDVPAAQTLSTDGSTLFVTGSGYGTHQFDFYTLAYDTATGETRWAARSDIKGNYDSPEAIVLSPDGSRVFVAGWSGYGVGDEEDWATIAYDAATGAQLWRQRLKGPGSSTDSPESAAVSPDGSRLFVTGFMWPGIFEKYWTTVSYDTVTGALLWRRSHSGDGGSVVSSSTGPTVYVAGSGAGERALVAYDGATGAVAWIAQDAGGYSWGRLAISPDSSRLFVKTAVYTPAGDSDVLVAAYAA